MDPCSSRPPSRSTSPAALLYTSVYAGEVYWLTLARMLCGFARGVWGAEGGERGM